MQRRRRIEADHVEIGHPNQPSALAGSRRSTSRNPATAASTWPRLACARASDSRADIARVRARARVVAQRRPRSCCAWRPSASPRLNHAEVESRLQLAGMPKVRQGFIGLALLEQGDAEPDSQIGILGAHRKDPPEAFDRLHVLAQALAHHAQQPDGVRLIRRQGQYVGQRLFRRLKLLCPTPCGPSPAGGQPPMRAAAATGPAPTVSFFHARPGHSKVIGDLGADTARRREILDIAIIRVGTVVVP